MRWLVMEQLNNTDSQTSHTQQLGYNGTNDESTITGGKAMNPRRLSRDEVGTRGSEIYEMELKAKLEPIAWDQFVAIDVETSEYEVAEEAHLASDKLHNRLPDPQVFVARIGHRAAFHAFGVSRERNG